MMIRILVNVVQDTPVQEGMRNDVPLAGEDRIVLGLNGPEYQPSRAPSRCARTLSEHVIRPECGGRILG